MARIWTGDNHEGARPVWTEAQLEAMRKRNQHVSVIRTGDKVRIVDTAHPAYGSVGLIKAATQQALTVEVDRRGGPRLDLARDQLRKIHR